jgi:glycerophosphoryl diester phosphodiesterase
MDVIAHRGASAHAPEHTIEAYDLALDQGADALELDVRQTADGTLVVLHDETLLRTTGDPRPVVCVPDRELARLPGAPLPLADVVDRYAGRTELLVEVKRIAADADPAFLALVDRPGVRVQSFDLLLLRRLRARRPGLPTAALLPEFLPPPVVRLALPRLARLGDAVSAHAASVDRLLVAAAHARGIAVCAYTVNDEAEMDRLGDLGVDGLITDRPGVAQRVRGSSRAITRSAIRLASTTSTAPTTTSPSM